LFTHCCIRVKGISTPPKMGLKLSQITITFPKDETRIWIVAGEEFAFPSMTIKEKASFPVNSNIGV
jgi:hypothetical protein